MSESPPDHVNITSNEAEAEFYYTVLNLPTTATDHEIRDRYRQLSMLFHPDRQRDKQTEQTAVKRFLEIQKAYEILSDPVTRQAYDLLGLEGVKLVAARQAWEGLVSDDVKAELIRRKAQADLLKLEQHVRSKGQFSMTVGALPPPTADFGTWYSNLWDRVRGARAVSFGMNYTATAPLTDRTKLSISGNSNFDDGDPVRNSMFGKGLVGTVRHQYSPRLSVQASTSLLSFRNLKLKANYRDEENQADVQVFISQTLFNAFFLQGNKSLRFLPPVVTTASRRLFPSSNLWARFTVSTLPVFPQFQLELSSSQMFDNFGVDKDDTLPGKPKSDIRPPSVSGLDTGVFFWSAGLALNGWLLGLVGNAGLHFAESGLRVKSGLNLGLLAQKITVGASWHGDDSEGNTSVGVDANIGTDGIALSLDVTYYNQRFYLPIILSTERDEATAFWTLVVPATMLTLTHHFILKPRRRKARNQFFNQARRELREAKSDVVRQAEETKLLLREAAQRHMDAEASVEGLVIIDARYGPAENGDALQGLTIDVTIPVQALVTKSQLYIPGRRSKAGLQGFYDPVPAAAKSLRVRYTFRGRAHYAEIPDYMPVVLPLEEHCVE